MDLLVDSLKSSFSDSLTFCEWFRSFFFRKFCWFCFCFSFFFSEPSRLYCNAIQKLHKTADPITRLNYWQWGPNIEAKDVDQAIIGTVTTTDSNLELYCRFGKLISPTILNSRFGKLISPTWVDSLWGPKIEAKDVETIMGAWRARTTISNSRFGKLISPTWFDSSLP